ncbi:MAG TPA: tRNA (adenosine(37)-N6)-dimethylallyltransferase MiaA [Candidatus Paceibacterota bacterium]
MAYKSKRNGLKILVILGPTATGKSNLAVKLAKKYKGEVVSADSRQVYTGLDIGTGKITKKEMRGVPHQMLDVVSPETIFSVVDWKKQAEKIIVDVLSRGKLPIICGGTGFYIQSIVDGIVLPEVGLNKTLRKRLEKKSTKELFEILKKLDHRRARIIDRHNPARLIRAIEIATAIGSVPDMRKQKSRYDILQIGLTLPPKKLKERIRIRLFARIREGMILETKKLRKGGLSWKRMRTLGLEYKYLADYLEQKLTRDEFIQKLEIETWHYVKRQMTWFKRDKRIKWFNPNQISKIRAEVDKFLA